MSGDQGAYQRGKSMILEFLYPEICNLYGEAFNVRYLEESVQDLKVIRTHLNDKPRFLVSDDVDLVYMGMMTESSQVLAIEKLKAYQKEIATAIEKGQRFMITGNALEIFGDHIYDVEDKEKTEALKIFPFHTKRAKMKRYSSLFLGDFNDLKIVGYKSQFTKSYYDDDTLEPLFKTKRGTAFNDEEKVKEGIRYKNFMATYLLGPLFIMNPYFTKWLLESIGAKFKLANEDAALDAYKARLKEYSDPNTGFGYSLKKSKVYHSN